jgi:hypothetical protein
MLWPGIEKSVSGSKQYLSAHLGYDCRGVHQVGGVSRELQAGVREAVLGSDVDGAESSPLQAVHAVAAGLKDVVVDLCLAQQAADAAGCRRVLGGNKVIRPSKLSRLQASPL